MKMFTNAIIVGLANIASSSKMEMLLDSSLNLPTVPPVHNPDKNGFPTMRSIQSVLGDYTHEKERLNHEAAELGLRLQKVEKEDADRIGQQNQVYLEKLKHQELENQAVTTENAKVARLIMKVREGNDKMSKLLEKEKGLVKLRRKQFTILRAQFMAGQKRVDKLLEGSDASTEPALHQTGDETSPKEEQVPVSFLEVGEERAAVSMTDEALPAGPTDPASSEPEAVSGSEGSAHPKGAVAGLTKLESEIGTQISSLAKQASKLNQATDQSLAELKASFEESFKEGAKRHSALMAQQDALKANLKSAEEQFAQLKATLKRVAGVRQGLEQELQKNGALMGEVQKMAATQVRSTPLE